MGVIQQPRKLLARLEVHTSAAQEVTRGAVYCLIAKIDDKQRVVKIGRSEFIYQRYAELLCGVPFPSYLLFAWVGSLRDSIRLENRLHRRFNDRNTAREWFLFDVEELETMFDEIAREMLDQCGRCPEWREVMEDDVTQFVTKLSKRRTKSKNRIGERR